jgi:hypothetical protein
VTTDPVQAARELLEQVPADSDLARAARLRLDRAAREELMTEHVHVDPPPRYPDPALRRALAEQAVADAQKVAGARRQQEEAQ